MHIRLEKNPSTQLNAESASWSMVSEYLEGDDRIILPVGSQEQHGRHMPVGVDWMIPNALGRCVSARSGVFCASPVCYGMAWMHSGFSGTLALKPETLAAVYVDLMEEMYAQGFRRILLLNGHGGNGNALNAALSKVVRAADDLRVKMYEWWRLPEIEEICQRAFGELDSHAGPAETSVMLHLYPDAIRMKEARDNESDYLPYYPNPRQVRELYPDGVMQNHATRADREVGREIIETCVEIFAHELGVGGAKGQW